MASAFVRKSTSSVLWAGDAAQRRWLVGVVQAHSWLISHFPQTGQDEIYTNPDAMVSAVIGPRGRAVKTADGYTLSGVWPFGSGCENLDWLLLGAEVFDENGNPVDSGDFAIRRTELTINCADELDEHGRSGVEVRSNPEHAPHLTEPSVAEVLELKRDVEVLVLQEADRALKVVSLLSRDPDLFALRLALDFQPRLFQGPIDFLGLVR